MTDLVPITKIAHSSSCIEEIFFYKSREKVYCVCRSQFERFRYWENGKRIENGTHADKKGLTLIKIKVIFLVVKLIRFFGYTIYTWRYITNIKREKKSYLRYLSVISRGYINTNMYLFYILRHLSIHQFIHLSTIINVAA